MTLFRKKCVLLVSIVLFSYSGYAQFTIPKKPKRQTSIYDDAALLSSSEARRLESKLLRYADTTSTQIVIATIQNLKGENIGLLAPKWAQQWGIGQAKEDNGIFILVAKEDRKIWIAPGYGAEEKFTAGISGEIVRNIIIPEFKTGKYYRGLDKGTSAVMEVLNGTYTNTNSGQKKKKSAGRIFFLVIIFISIVIILSNKKNNRNGGRGFRGGHLTDILILSSLGRGAFGGSSSGSSGSFGGGFSGGFGGGGFSGGGAGGSW